MVGDSTEISNSVIGSRCTIGHNCVLENAYVFDGVVIGNKCILKNCVIGANTKIQKETTIHRGSVIGNRCIVPTQSSIDKQFIVASARDDDDDYGMSILP